MDIIYHRKDGKTLFYNHTETLLSKVAKLIKEPLRLAELHRTLIPVKLYFERELQATQNVEEIQNLIKYVLGIIGKHLSYTLSLNNSHNYLDKYVADTDIFFNKIAVGITDTEKLNNINYYKATRVGEFRGIIANNSNNLSNMANIYMSHIGETITGIKSMVQKVMNLNNTKQQFISSYISFADQLSAFILNVKKRIETNVPVNIPPHLQLIIDNNKREFLRRVGYNEENFERTQVIYDSYIKTTIYDVYESLYSIIQKHLLEEEKYLLKSDFITYLDKHMKPYTEHVLLQDLLPIIYQIKESIMTRYNRLLAEIDIKSLSHTKSNPLNISLIPLKLHPQNTEYLQSSYKAIITDYQYRVPWELVEELHKQLRTKFYQKANQSYLKKRSNPLYTNISKDIYSYLDNIKNEYDSTISPPHNSDIVSKMFIDNILNKYIISNTVFYDNLNDFIYAKLKSVAVKNIGEYINTIGFIIEYSSSLSNNSQMMFNEVLIKKQDDFLDKIQAVSSELNIQKTLDEIIKTMIDMRSQIKKQSEYDSQLLLIKSDIISTFTDYIQKAVTEIKTQIKITDISLIDNANINDTIIKFTESVNSEESAENIQKIYAENVKIIDAKIVAFVALDLIKTDALDKFINYTKQLIVDNPEQKTIENLNMLITEETDKLLHKLRFLNNTVDIQTMYNESVKLLNNRLSVELGIQIYTGILKTIVDNITISIIVIFLIINTVLYQYGKSSSLVEIGSQGSQGSQRNNYNK